MEVENGEQPVTKEILLDKAKQAGANLVAIKEKFPQTANALLLDSEIVNQQVWSDPDALTAKQMAMDYEYGLEANSVNLANSLFDEGDSVINTDRVGSGLSRLIDLTSDQDPQTLHNKLSGQRQLTRSKIESDKGSAPNVYDSLVTRFRRQSEALQELKPHLGNR